MDAKTWYHCRFNPITEELGPIQLGKAKPDTDTDLFGAMDRGIQFEFWIPGSPNKYRGHQVYIFSSHAGWKDGLEVRLESAFPEVKGIQAAIREKIRLDLDESYEITSLGREEIAEFLQAISTLKNGDHLSLMNSSDQTGFEKTEEMGLHEDFSGSYNFAFIARVTLP